MGGRGYLAADLVSPQSKRAGGMMAQGTRKSKKVVIAVGFEDDDFAAIEAERKKDDRSFTSMVRILVREALQARRAAEQKPFEKMLKEQCDQ